MISPAQTPMLQSQPKLQTNPSKVLNDALQTFRLRSDSLYPISIHLEVLA